MSWVLAGVRARAALAVEVARTAPPAWARVEMGCRARLWSAELLPTLDALRWLAVQGPRALQAHRLPSSPVQWY